MTDSTKDLSAVAKLSPIAASVVAALQPAGTVLAQDGADTIDEITVTANKREGSLQDLGQSISAITNLDISKKAILSMDDLIMSVPSATIYATQPGRNTITFRGMSTGTNEWRTDSQVAVYLDEQPMTAISQQIDPRFVDIERVESLPGPQGTLFGSSSTAGTLRIITNKPDLNGFSGNIETTYKTTKGGEDSYDVNGVLNIPFSETFGIRAVAYSAKEGGWIDNVYGMSLTGLEDNADVVEEDFNDWEIKGGRLSAKWLMGEKWDVLLNFMTQESDTEGVWQTDPALGDDKVSMFHKETHNDEWDSMAITIKGDLGFAELTSSTAWVDRSIVYTRDNHVYDAYKSTAAHYGTYCAYYTSYCYLGGLYDLDYIIGTIFNDQIQKRFSTELRLSSISDSRFQWMLGAFYEDVDDEWFYGTITPGLGNTPAYAYANYWAYYYNYYGGYDIEYPLPNRDLWWVQDYQRNVKQTAVFGEMSFDVSDAWTISVGARWFENERYRYERNTFPEGLPSWGQFATNGVDEVQGKTDDTTFKIGATWDVNDNNMVYGLYSQGFRLGGYNSLRASSAGFVDRIYDPDSMDNYEFGHKGTFMDGRLQINTSIFHMVWEDIQLPRWNDNIWWQNGNLNGGEAEQTGVELTLIGQFTDNFRVNASVYGGDGEFTEDVYSWDITGDDPNTPEVERVRWLDTPAGTPKPFAPDLKYSIGLEYTIRDAFWDGDLAIYYYLNGQDDTYSSRGFAEGGVPNIPSWNVSNLNLTWMGDNGLEIALRARNLFDDKYIQTISTGDNWIMDGWFPNDPRYRNQTSYNRPREISLMLRYNF